MTDEEKRNIRAKRKFEDAIDEAKLSKLSIRDLALFFGVKRSKLYERMSDRRKDLAPLDEWFAKLARHKRWLEDNEEFARRIA